MAKTKISELSAAAALTGAEVVAAVQSGATVKATLADIAALVPSSFTDAEVLSIQSLMSVGGNVPAGSGWRTMQDALNVGFLALAAGAHTLVEPLLIGAATTVKAVSGVTVTASGTYQHNMLRVGNADYLSSQDSVTGVYVLCADERTSYAEGTLTYTHSGTTLTWQIDGDTAGTPMSISTVADASTGGIFEIPSGTGGSLYVVVVVAAARNSTRTRRVRVEPITGMRPMTWSRTSSVLTVTEAGHARQPGDVVQLWGTNARGHFVVASAQPGSWTAVDARSNNSGTGRAFGVNRVSLNIAGSVWDAGNGTLTAANTGLCTMPFLLFCCGGLRFDAPTVTRFAKYAIYLTGCGNTRGRGLRVTGLASLNNDGLHICGPNIDGEWDGVSGTSGDNLTAVGCCDYASYNIFWPEQGDIDVSDWTLRNLRGEGAVFELFRIYNANTGKVRNFTVENLSGTVSSTSSAAWTVMSDATASQVDAGNTNIDGLTVRNVNVVRADGSQMPTYRWLGTGTRRNLRMERVTPLPLGAVAGTVVVQSVLEDLTITFAEPANAFAGAAVALNTATSRVKKLRLEGVRVRGDNAMPVTLGTGSAAQPILLDLSHASAQVDNLEVSGVVLEDVSSSGNKARLVSNSGVITKATLNGARTTGTDSWWRQNSGANAATEVSASNCDFAGTFGIAADAGMAAIRESNCRVAGTAHQFAVTAAFKLDAVNCVYDNTFIRGAANNPIVTFTAVNCTATASLSTTGGTPSYRLGGNCGVTLDGALLDATVANHAAGASFYNSNAAFGVPGVGAYVRGAAAWVRVAA